MNPSDLGHFIVCELQQQSLYLLPSNIIFLYLNFIYVLQVQKGREVNVLLIKAR